MSTFVSVGNGHQPFTRLLDAVEALAPTLPHPVVVQHGHTPFASTQCMCVDFMPMDAFIKHVGSASLVIMHAGVGSILSAVQAAKLPIVVPRLAAMNEIIDDHQLELAIALAGAGRVLLVEDMAQLGAAVIKAVNGRGGRSAGEGGAKLVESVRAALRRNGKSGFST